MPAGRSAVLNVMVQTAQKVGRRLVRDFGEVEHLQVSKKGPADFVSAADRAAEKILVEELQKARPKYSFLLEERGVIEGTDSSNRWIIDPLDGTSNFLHGIPHFAISIALERDNEIFAGVIYNPVVDELYTAEKGTGSFLNGRRLRVSARRDMDQALFATGIPFKGAKDHPEFLKQLEAVMSVSAGIRRFGAASLDLAYVAAGRFDGFWETALQPWDIAAGIVLVREAGGFVTEIDGGGNILDSGSILAANDALHPALGRLLRETAEN
ncbi:MAG: inositol monophosphatase family protein [Rhodospirillales bacterium]|jgi:myo-inositol-1(or 4)-monophosphatase